EIRQVGQTARRLAEAARLGFRQALVPRSTPGDAIGGIELVRVEHLADALTAAGLDGGEGRRQGTS
ncbi:MAG TPA: DNA repair protein RadA, partial [Acidimicrobiia bacterium]|nr:DNA repair protein RadA [Acidimicrobiia bacterium]